MTVHHRGREVIKEVGVSAYSLWLYLKNRNFIRPAISDIAKDFKRSPITIKLWMKKLEDHGYL